MARYIGSSCKLSRRMKNDLGLKSRGLRDISTKCKINVLPGQHGQKRKKISDYSLQLSAKQMIKYIYGVMEKQFKNYYKVASKSSGETGIILLELLERRLDNVIYRMGFSSTRAEAKQLISHKSIIVKPYGNTLKSGIVSISSYLLNPGDIILVKESSKNQIRIKSSLKYISNVGYVPWVDVDIENMLGLFKRIPDRSELPLELKEQLVVEFYSK